MPLFIGKNTGIRRVSGWGLFNDPVAPLSISNVFDTTSSDKSYSLPGPYFEKIKKKLCDFLKKKNDFFIYKNELK